MSRKANTDVGDDESSDELQEKVPSQSFTLHLKVLKIVDSPATTETKEDAGNDVELPNTSRMVPVITLRFTLPDTAAYDNMVLSDLRSRITPVINGTYRFASQDGSIFEDHTSLATYFGGTMLHPPVAEEPAAPKSKLSDGGGEKDDVKETGKRLPDEGDKAKKTEPAAVPFVPQGQNKFVYVRPFKRDSVSTSEFLDHPPFILKFVQILEDNELQKEGALHSSSFEALKGGNLQLGKLRKYVKDMSPNPKFHKFCLEDGHLVEDTITLKEYVASSSKTIENKEQSTPSIEVYFSKPGILRKEKPNSVSDFVKNSAALKHTEGFKGTDAINVQRSKDFQTLKEELDTATYRLSTGGEDAKSATLLTERQWDEVIRNTSVMFGWVVDPITHALTRAPRAAFRLKAGLNTVTEQDQQSADANVAKKPEGNTDTAVAAATTETGAQTGKTSSPTAVAPSTSSIGKSATKPGAIPNFVVDDASRIEVALTTHEFQMSMAKAHFSATSIEASGSRGVGPTSVGISGKVETAKTEEDKAKEQCTEKRLVATYYFPRATINFLPGDLEPTVEFKEAIERIIVRRKTEDLKQLYQEFGHMFCLKSVLGGCLQTSKIIKLNSTESEHSAKEQFKASVGVAVQTPAISAEAKASHERGESEDKGEKTTDTSEKLAFEATGGNTILASDPNRWTASIADHQHWRTIEQDNTITLVEALSRISGYSDAPKWFLQVVPESCKFVEVPTSRALYMRMKVLANQGAVDETPDSKGNGHHFYLGHDPANSPKLIHVSLKKREVQKPVAVAAPVKKPEPPSFLGFLRKGWNTLETGIETVATKAVTKAGLVADEVLHLGLASYVDLHHDPAKVDYLFYPKQPRAPVLLCPGDPPALPAVPKDDATNDEKNKYETAKQELLTKYNQTVWRLDVPDGQRLGHESLVIIRSLASDPSPCLSVYRNQQGIYLPGMVDHDNPSFWRILKTNKTSLAGDAIQDADIIRLCWRFSDQTNGFRDFHDDTFGRRTSTIPNGAADDLYLKVPLPSIQDPKCPTALMMHPIGDNRPFITNFPVLPSREGKPKIAFNLYDICFRLDSAGKFYVALCFVFQILTKGHLLNAGADGKGELEDYLTYDLVKERPETDKPTNDGSGGPDKPELPLLLAGLLIPGTGPVAAGLLMKSLFF
ncbi:unnamed protein product [Rhizoctonia solani]|uniref:MACPF-like domain-containing protein n=1 Tax=Rhizoctonia solani TaxID=456999 RepID=A0A8H3GW98_9AGAM|nr:unnamed protein product [Rhizoctonia solani]